MNEVGAYQVVDPPVSFRLYWPEGLLLFLSLSTPLVAWIIWRDPDMFGRSGSVMTFLALLAEFVSLHRMNTKHLLNDCRVNAGEIPWKFSRASQVVSLAALICALSGTIIWGYGDLWF